MDINRWSVGDGGDARSRDEKRDREARSYIQGWLDSEDSDVCRGGRAGRQAGRADNEKNKKPKRFRGLARISNTRTGGVFLFLCFARICGS